MFLLKNASFYFLGKSTRIFVSLLISFVLSLSAHGEDFSNLVPMEIQMLPGESSLSRRVPQRKQSCKSQVLLIASGTLALLSYSLYESFPPSLQEVDEDSTWNGAIGIDLKPQESALVLYSLADLENSYPFGNKEGWCAGITCISHPLIKNSSFQQEGSETKESIKTKFIQLTRGEKVTFLGAKDSAEFFQRYEEHIRGEVERLQNSLVDHHMSARSIHHRENESQRLGLGGSYSRKVSEENMMKFSEDVNGVWKPTDELSASEKLFDRLKGFKKRHKGTSLEESLVKRPKFDHLSEADLGVLKGVGFFGNQLITNAWRVDTATAFGRANLQNYIETSFANKTWNQLPKEERERLILEDISLLKKALRHGATVNIGVQFPNGKIDDHTPSHAVRIVGYLEDSQGSDRASFFVYDPNHPKKLRLALAVRENSDGQLQWVFDERKNADVRTGQILQRYSSNEGVQPVYPMFRSSFRSDVRRNRGETKPIVIRGK